MSVGAMSACGAGLAVAATPVDQNGQPVHSQDTHARPRPARENPRETPAAKHQKRQDAHKANEPGGKAGAEAKGHGPAAQGTDQKGHVAPHVAPPVAVVPPPPKAPTKESGEPPPKLPRFAALKTDDTNMRKGPGQRYPIEWVYKRRDLPMQVEREYDVWRYVRDPDGVEGWVHQVTLSDRRTFMVQPKDAVLRADPNDTASAVATLKAGVIGRLRTCDAGSNWCQVQVQGYKGYLRRDQVWGVLPGEVVAPS